MAPRITLIACVSSNEGIGYQGQLLFDVRENPWIKEDLERFKRTTLGHYVVMGRKTAESLPRGEPLPGRFNIVLTENTTHDEIWHQKGFIPCHSKEEVLVLTADEAEIFIIGGAGIYKMFLPHANRILLTRVGATPPADTFFPRLPITQWKLRQTEVGRAEPPPAYVFQEWVSTHRR